jgi:hypothetical protein
MSGTYVADGTHHTFTQSSLTVKNLANRGSKACNSYVEEIGIKCLWRRRQPFSRWLPVQIAYQRGAS